MKKPNLLQIGVWTLLLILNGVIAYLVYTNWTTLTILTKVLDGILVTGMGYFTAWTHVKIIRFL